MFGQLGAEPEKPLKVTEGTTTVVLAMQSASGGDGGGASETRASSAAPVMFAPLTAVMSDLLGMPSRSIGPRASSEFTKAPRMDPEFPSVTPTPTDELKAPHDQSSQECIRS